MEPLVTAKGIRAIALVTLVGLAFVLLTRFFGPAASQRHNLDAASAHALKVLPLVQRDLRFTNVTLDMFTCGDGGLWVHACLRSDRDSNDLVRLVESTHPPVPTRYEIYIDPNSEARNP